MTNKELLSEIQRLAFDGKPYGQESRALFEEARRRGFPDGFWEGGYSDEQIASWGKNAEAGDADQH